MTKKILFFLMALVPLLSEGQVTVSVQLPPAGMIQKDQLWNLVLVNNSNEMLEATISLNIRDAVTGQTVLSAGTRNFLLGKGVKMLNYRDIQPIQYNYTTAQLTNNYIPLGSYVACYRIIRIMGEEAKPLADECVRLNINPLSPPLLNTPADKSIQQSAYPQFSWVPPSPAEMFSNLNYDIVITEVLQGQSPAEAVINNVPVYANGNIKKTFESYPAAFSSLLPGKLYAWQVTANNGLNYSAQTEVWSFSIKPADSIKMPVSSAAYIVLRNRQESSGISYINNKEELFLKYYSFDKDHKALVRFLAADGRIIKEEEKTIAYGDNFLRFKLTREFKEKENYTVEITDNQKNIYYARFSIQ